MITNCVEVRDLSKFFRAIKRERTALQTVRELLAGKRLKSENWVLQDLSFEVKKGEKLALIGRNGSGKTTLLKILSGIYKKNSGYMKVNCVPHVLFDCWVAFNADLSVIDNIYLFGAIYGMRRGFLKEKIDEILLMSGLCDQRFSTLKTLSTGQQQRLALSVFIHSPSDLLMFDESLAYVDRVFSENCMEEYFNKLYSSKSKTVIITSTDNSFLKKYCENALWIDDGYIRMEGSVSDVIDEYEKFCRDQ